MALLYTQIVRNRDETTGNKLIQSVADLAHIMAAVVLTHKNLKRETYEY